MFTAVLETDTSETAIVIEVGGASVVPPFQVTRSLAPLGADRFYALVKDGFYQDSAIFRVVPKFVLQFGISGNPENNNKWLHNNILDDPVLGSNTRGTICFAIDGPNTRTSQVFINFANNSRLDTNNFAPFGKVVSGMEVAEAVFNPTPGDRGGIDQAQYEELGNAWIREKYPGVNFITKAYIKE